MDSARQKSLERSENAALRDLDNSNKVSHDTTKQLMLMATVAFGLTPLIFSNEIVLRSLGGVMSLLIIFWISTFISMFTGVATMLRDQKYYLKSARIKQLVHDYINSTQYSVDSGPVKDIKIAEIQKDLNLETSNILLLIQILSLAIGYLSLTLMLIILINKIT